MAHSRTAEADLGRAPGSSPRAVAQPRSRPAGRPLLLPCALPAPFSCHLSFPRVNAPRTGLCQGGHSRTREPGIPGGTGWWQRSARTSSPGCCCLCPEHKVPTVPPGSCISTAALSGDKGWWHWPLPWHQDKEGCALQEVAAGGDGAFVPLPVLQLISSALTPRGHTSSEDEHGCFGCSGPFVPLQKPTGSFQTSEEM